MKFDNATLNSTWARIVAATKKISGSVQGDGFKHVHDALISYTGLKRSTTPQTPGDYLKGIAVCARKLYGVTNYTSGKSSLADIVMMLENADIDPPEPSTAWEIRDVAWEGNFWISDGYFYVGGDPWVIVRADNGASVGSVNLYEPISLLLLDTRTDYYVTSDAFGGVGCRLVYVDGPGVIVDYLFREYNFAAYREYELGACDPSTVYYLYYEGNEYSSVSDADGQIFFENEKGTILMSGQKDYSTETYKWYSSFDGTYSVYRK